ncbi:MAG TPA: hypothetical protein VGF27_26155, partial [Pseudoduganella sp.]
MSITRRDFISSAAVVGTLALTGCQIPITSAGDNAVASKSKTASKIQNRRMHRILHVVTNVSHYDDPSHPTGLWVSEFTHAYDAFEAQGYEQTVVSPREGEVPIEPRSLKWPYFDKSARAGKANPLVQSLLANSHRPEEINAADYDVIYFAGGHGVMWDFPESSGLQNIPREI